MKAAGQENGHADSTSETDQRRLLNRFSREIIDDPDDWRYAYLRVVAAWPIENDFAYGERFHYFIADEALNWKRLAERIAAQIGDEYSIGVTPDAVYEWLGSSGTFGGLGETEFRRILGVDGWRAHMNHFYGVQIEQCIIADVEARIQKRRFAVGMPPTDDAADRAFVGLYEETESVLWQEFIESAGTRLSQLIEECDGDRRSLALDEEFTYWLFKRRVEYTNAPQVAAETRRGLDMIAKMRRADDRRARYMKTQDGGTLLEFGLLAPRRKVRTSAR